MSSKAKCAKKLKLFMVNGIIINVCTSIYRTTQRTHVFFLLYCLINPQFSTTPTKETDSIEQNFNITAVVVYTFVSFYFCFLPLPLSLSFPLSLTIPFDDLWLSFKCFTVNVASLSHSTWLYFDIAFLVIVGVVDSIAFIAAIIVVIFRCILF